MSRRFSILLVILVILSGLVGGAISGRIFAPRVAIAEEIITSKVLDVEELRVMSKSGKGGVLIRIDDDSGDGRITVFGEDGKIRNMIYSFESSGLISVFGKENKEGVSIYGGKDIGGSIGVKGKDEKIRAIIGVGKDGNGSIGLYDKNGGRLK